jgi:RNA polymerase sigma factor (sigma-70 family)
VVDVREFTAAALVAAAAGGDQRAWDELIDRYGRLVQAVCRTMPLSRQDREDVFQITWFRLSENLTRLRDPERIGGWLATTARNECYRLLRAGTRVVAVDEPSPPVDDRPSVEDQIVQAELRAAIREAFALLSDRCQRLLSMIIDPDVDYLTIAATLGMPVGSIGPTRGRCLEHLKAELAHLYPSVSSIGGAQ